MRELASHKINGLNDALLVRAVDGPGQGGASHVYTVQNDGDVLCRVAFQNGPINEVGVNGISQEALLAIVEDRLKSFQAGPYACRENAIALTHIQDAMHWLYHRTRERVARGVEGTSEK